MIETPHPELEELLTMIGAAGRHMAEIGACEGAAGNISVCMRWPVEPHALFPIVSEVELSKPVPELAGVTFLVSGSGRRLREIIDDPTANVACIVVDKGGKTGQLHTSRHCRFERVTSEFNSHLAVHSDQLNGSNATFHAIIHVQPIHLTYLSHIPRYQDEKYLNTHLLRWQPETILNLFEGIGFIPFRVPGSPELMEGNVEALHSHRIVIWAKHGVMARSSISVKRAADLVEYAETAAKYEYLNLLAGEIGEGLSAEEIRSICKTFNIEQDIF